MPASGRFLRYSERLFGWAVLTKGKPDRCMSLYSWHLSKDRICELPQYSQLVLVLGMERADYPPDVRLNIANIYNKLTLRLVVRASLGRFGSALAAPIHLRNVWISSAKSLRPRGSAMPMMPPPECKRRPQNGVLERRR